MSLEETSAAISQPDLKGDDDDDTDSYGSLLYQHLFKTRRTLLNRVGHIAPNLYCRCHVDP